MDVAKGEIMFLNALSAEDKPKFLACLYLAARADGEVVPQEAAHIGAYANEMGIANADAQVETEDSIAEHFSTRPETIRKIVLAELLALAHADDKFHDAERHFVKTMRERLGLSETFMSDVISWVESIRPLYARGFQLVGLA